MRRAGVRPRRLRPREVAKFLAGRGIETRTSGARGETVGYGRAAAGALSAESSWRRSRLRTGIGMAVVAKFRGVRDALRISSRPT
jgi:hypothetical protein